MKRLFALASIILAAAAVFGAWFQTLAIDVEATPPAAFAELLGFGVAPWPFVFPSIGALICVYMITTGRGIREDKAGKSRFILTLRILFGPVLALLLQGLVALLHFNVVESVGAMRFLMGAAYVVFLLAGNFIAAARRESGIGLRTPWSVRSDRAWTKTQRFLGRAVVALSLLGFGLLFVKEPLETWWIFFAGILAATALAFAYSYFAWRKGAAG